MRIAEVHFEGSPPVEGYGPGFFRLDGAVWEGPLALLPGGPERWPGLPEIAPFLEQSGAIDVPLVGMGAEIRPLDPGLRTRLEAAGIGVEIMATGAACRTYNLLLAEGRRIAAALAPV